MSVSEPALPEDITFKFNLIHSIHIRVAAGALQPSTFFPMAAAIKGPRIHALIT